MKSFEEAYYCELSEVVHKREEVSGACQGFSGHRAT